MKLVSELSLEAVRSHRRYDVCKEEVDRKYDAEKEELDKKCRAVHKEYMERMAREIDEIKYGPPVSHPIIVCPIPSPPV